MEKRQIDTGAYVSVLRELVEEGREVSMTISGNSMSPFLVHERDMIYFCSPERELRKGDMVFYLRDNGQYVMHRIVQVTPQGYDITGDAQYVIERNVRRDQIFARITKVKRKGKWIGPGNFWWEFFEHVWIRIIPLRRPLVAAYTALCRKKGVKA